MGKNIGKNLSSKYINKFPDHDYSDAYTHVKASIAVPNTAEAPVQNINKKLYLQIALHLLIP